MTLLTNIQETVAERLTKENFFSDAAAETPQPLLVLTEQIGDLAARIRQSIGTLGIVCVVLTPTAVSTSLNRQRPYFDEVRIVVRVQENVVLNRAANGTGQPASLVAEAVAWFLHGFVPEGLGCSLRLEAIRLVADPRLLVYETAFTMQAGLRFPPRRVPATA